MADFSPPFEASELHGPDGRSAVRIDMPDVPHAAMAVDVWLLTAPDAHPLWSQFALSCVRLVEAPGWPPPILLFPGATHELLVVALNPDDGPFDRATLTERARLGVPMPYLLPVNIVEQFTATDEEMRKPCWSAASGVALGALPPETADAPEQIREHWLGHLVRALAHIRGEQHAGGPLPEGGDRRG